MTLPLYKELYNESPNRYAIGADGHKGLWFERFYNVYTDISAIRPKKDMMPSEKSALIEREIQWLKEFPTDKVGDKAALATKALQQMNLCEHLQGKMFFTKTQWHFVTGMGLNHPIENGMAWHPTLGVPYLTGAAVKGMVRAWLEVWDIEDNQQEQKETLKRWFGSDDKESNNTQAGSLIFFDALPIESPLLGVDIMTPHMGDWYAKGQEITNIAKDSDKLPADWHNPVPVQFLVVKEARLQFCIAPRNKKCANDIDMVEVIKALQEALEWMGAGAKTAVGYGHFEEDQKAVAQLEATKAKAEEKRKKAQKIAARKKMSPTDAFRDTLQDNDLTEKAIAEMFGKDSKKTKQDYHDQEGAWETIITILLDEKSHLIRSWQDAGKKTAEGKAYKNLKESLPQTTTMVAIIDSTEQITHYNVATHHTYQPSTFDAAFYPQNDAQRLVVIGANNSAWFDLLTTMKLDEIEGLEEIVDALMEADGDTQQQQLEPFSQPLSDLLSIPCEFFVSTDKKATKSRLDAYLPSQDQAIQTIIDMIYLTKK